MYKLIDKHKLSLELFLGGMAMVCWGTACVLMSPAVVAMEVMTPIVEKRISKK